MAESLASTVRGAGHGTSDFTAHRILSRIHVYRVHNVNEQISVIRILPSFLSQHPSIRLIGIYLR